MAELEAENAWLRRELADAEHRGKRLRGELQHRVRNLLAVIRSIARRTALASETAEDYAMHFEGRLGAIARAQAMVMRNPADCVDLGEMVAEELLAHAAHEGEQVSLSGPAIRLLGKAAETIALAVHELAANAVKYGALSGSRGHIAVTWGVEQKNAQSGDAGQVLRLEWRETGVPLRSLPSRRKGFGTELIERTLAYELGATGSLGFGHDGVRCTVVVPLADEVATPGECP